MGNFIFLHLSIIFLSTLFIFQPIQQLALAALGKCDYEKYDKGCYLQANFICDKSTNMCTCDPSSPVLIEQRLCLPRVKLNGICQYNDQCDTDNGIYCSYSDHEVLNNSPASRSSAKHFTGTSPKCRYIKTLTSNHNSSKHRQQQSSQQTKQNQSSTPTILSLARVYWILAGIFALILLLIFIKSQNHISPSPFRPQEDQMSVSSIGLDVPPPYEVAIRMKL